jgi:CBS domain-containing protein
MHDAEVEVLVGEACNREVVFIDKTDSIRNAAGLMRQHHVGTVIVTAGPEGERTPVGILTDRDITIELIAQDIDIDSVSVADVMSGDLLRLNPDEGIMEALQLMKGRGVRRAPVINENGGLIGILALDDILELIAEQLLDVVTLQNHAHQKEERIRR